MWDAAKQNSYASFEQVYNTLLSKEERSIPLIFPVRIWLRGFEDKDLENRPLQPNFRTEGKNEDEVCKLTVLDLLGETVPGIVEANERFQVKVQGVVLSLETPLLWLLYHTSSADLWIYLTVIREKKLTPEINSSEL